MESEPEPRPRLSPSQIITTYLETHSETFRELQELRKKGWANTTADKHFQQQRQNADQAGPALQKKFFNMMRRLGDEMQQSTGVIKLNSSAASVLDLCAAPGGFITTALKYNPTATVSAISLPINLGGHQLLVKHGKADPRVTVNFMDITMLGHEFGLEISENPIPNMSADRPYLGQSYDLVFCDGVVLRNHAQYREAKRENLQARRLACSQLILALQSIREGGTLIMLLHKVEQWHTLQTLHAFSGFSSIKLFKPKKCHAARSSFYLIATDVRPDAPAAKVAVQTWKGLWKEATVDVPEESDPEDSMTSIPAEREEEIGKLLEEFQSGRRPC